MDIAIVDDLGEDRKKLLDLLNKYTRNTGNMLNIDEYTGGDLFIKNIGTKSYDIVFLDIYMGNINGIDTARIIRQLREESRIVFLTTSNEFAAESYEVQATGYLIKPIDEQHCFELLDKMCITEPLLRIKTRGKIGICVKIPYSDVMYIDVIKKIARVHIKNDILEIEQNFTELNDLLIKDQRFCSCNRGVIVNFEYVAGISENDFLMKNGEAIAIKNIGRQEIKKSYMTYKIKNVMGEYV